MTFVHEDAASFVRTPSKAAPSLLCPIGALPRAKAPSSDTSRTFFHAEPYASIAAQLVVTSPPPAPNSVSCNPAARNTLKSTVLVFSCFVER
jgi:hypothetical protein